MNARALPSSARSRSRRAPRRWMTEAEAEAALAADPTRLSVADQVSLYERIELRADTGVFADLVSLMVFQESDERVRRVPLDGRRSTRHTMCYLRVLFEWRWTGPEAWMQAAIRTRIPRLSSRQLQRMDARQLVLVHHCLEVSAPQWTAAESIALIVRLHHACAARHDVMRSLRWTREHITAWLERHPDAPLPGAFVTTFLCAPEPETRAWAFEALLPRIDTLSIAGGFSDR